MTPTRSGIVTHPPPSKFMTLKSPVSTPIRMSSNHPAMAPIEVADHRQGRERCFDVRVPSDRREKERQRGQQSERGSKGATMV